MLVEDVKDIRSTKQFFRTCGELARDDGVERKLWWEREALMGGERRRDDHERWIVLVETMTGRRMTGTYISPCIP
jgi:hypothetical protein